MALHLLHESVGCDLCKQFRPLQKRKFHTIEVLFPEGASAPTYETTNAAKKSTIIISPSEECTAPVLGGTISRHCIWRRARGVSKSWTLQPLPKETGQKNKRALHCVQQFFVLLAQKDCVLPMLSLVHLSSVRSSFR